MVRGKLKMELIRDPKSRNATFGRRKAGLLKKIEELTVVCEVKACMIIHGPKEGKNSSSQTALWPEEAHKFSHVISLYRGKPTDKRIRLSGLSDFFEDRKKEIEDEIEKLRKKNREMIYPSTIDCMMSCLPEVKLREFATKLNNKVDLVELRIECMKLGMDHRNYPMQRKFSILNGALPQQIDNSNGILMQSGIEEWWLMNRHHFHLTQEEAIPMLSDNNIPIHHGMHSHYQGPMNHYYANAEQEHYHRDHMNVVNHNTSMMRLLMNEDDDLQMQRASSYIDDQFASSVYCRPVIADVSGVREDDGGI